MSFVQELLGRKLSKMCSSSQSGRENNYLREYLRGLKQQLNALNYDDPRVLIGFIENLNDSYKRINSEGALIGMRDGTYPEDVKQICAQIAAMKSSIENLQKGKLEELNKYIEIVLAAIRQERERLQQAKPEDARHEVLDEIERDLGGIQGEAEEGKKALDPHSTDPDFSVFKGLAEQLVSTLKSYSADKKLDKKYSCVSKAIRYVLNSMIDVINQRLGFKIGLFSMSGRTQDLIDGEVEKIEKFVNPPKPGLDAGKPKVASKSA